MRHFISNFFVAVVLTSGTAASADEDKTQVETQLVSGKQIECHVATPGGILPLVSASESTRAVLLKGAKVTWDDSNHKLFTVSNSKGQTDVYGSRHADAPGTFVYCVVTY